MMKVRLIMLLVLVVWMLTACGNRKLETDLSIRAVAGQYVQDLYADDQMELFVFKLPEQAVVPDHSTGPRLIILLTDLQANRLENGDEIKAEKDQVFYLTNEFSKGFVNSANKAAYLVLGLKQGELAEQAEHACDHNRLIQMFSQGDLVVCKSSKTQTVKFETAVLVFSTKTNQLSQYAADATIPLSEHDLLIKHHGFYQ